jgi:ABC-type xylose transport system permease subunit
MANPTEVVSSQSGQHTPLIGFFERAPVIAGALVTALGALVLVGWMFDLTVITTVGKGGLPVLPLTALCFVLSGISLLLAAGRHHTPRRETIQQILAALLATIAVLTLYEYLRESGPGFDLLLFGNRLRSLQWYPPGRIALNTAATLLLFALALLSLPHDQRRQDMRAQTFATPALLIPLVAIIGYVFGVKGMYTLSQSSGMPLPTAIGLLILGSGIVFAVRDRGVAPSCSVSSEWRVNPPESTRVSSEYRCSRSRAF